MNQNLSKQHPLSGFVFPLLVKVDGTMRFRTVNKQYFLTLTLSRGEPNRSFPGQRCSALLMPNKALRQEEALERSRRMRNHHAALSESSLRYWRKALAEANSI